jgi:hypothetical protein
MRKSVRAKQLVSAAGFVILSTGIVSIAEAQTNLDSRLRGEYAFANTKTCVVSNLAFEGPNLAIPQAPPPPAPAPIVSRVTQSISGIARFNGDGTATVIGRFSSLNIAQPAAVGSAPANTAGFGPLAQGEFTNEMTYTVNPDGTVDTAQTTIAVTVFPVFPTPITSRVIGGTVGRLQISQDHKTLISAGQNEASVEQVFSPPTATAPSNYRLCINNPVFIKIGGD